MDAKAVDFVTYSVGDLETSLPFYRDTLGLHLEKHIEEYGWAEFALEPTTLALQEDESVAEDAEEDGDEEAWTGAAVAIAVDDVEAAAEELRDEGVTITLEPFDTGACDMAHVADPDGNPIILHRRHDGTHGRKDPFPE